MTDIMQKLRIVPGTPLESGQMYLRLFHGRRSPAEELDDWGFDGPVFGPLSALSMTYLTTIRIYGHCLSDEVWIDTTHDLVQWEDGYFGDFEIFIAGPNAKA